MTDEQREVLESVEPSRRSFIKKMAAAAFAVPVITSFGMESMASAAGRPSPRQSFPNQPRPRDHDHDHDHDHDDDDRGHRRHH